jgi:hypothetical protein
MRTTLVAAALVAALAPGCFYDESGVDDAETSPLLHRLGTRAVLTLEDSSHIAITATGADGQRLPAMEADIVQGRAALRATPEGVIVVEALEIDLSDVAVPPGALSESAYHLTDLQLRLGIQLGVVPEWSEDRRHAIGHGQADLLLHWSLAVDGEIYPMATRKLAGTPFDIEVDIDEGNNVTARISTSVSGRLSNFIDRIMLSDFSMELDATSLPEID